MDDLTNTSGTSAPPDQPDPWPATIERWLAEAVVPVFDAMQADPSRGIPAKDVATALDAVHAEWLKHGGRGA